MTNMRSARRTVVLIPLYKQSMTLSEMFSFKNTLSVLSKHDICVVCPKRLSDYLSVLKKETLLNFDVEYFADRYFSDLRGYNHLLMSAGFYLRFDSYEYILIVQTDALVFSDQLEEWCDRNYSYVGAPWFQGIECPDLPLSLFGVGNGGFSLRKVRDFIKVLSFPKYIPYVSYKVPPRRNGIRRLVRFIKQRIIFSYNYYPFRANVNEDIFWGWLVPGCCDFFSVPSAEAAIPFAFELAPEYLFELNGRQLPFGCHAWEKYNLQFWRDTLNRVGMVLP